MLQSRRILLGTTNALSSGRWSRHPPEFQASDWSWPQSEFDAKFFPAGSNPAGKEASSPNAIADECGETFPQAAPYANGRGPHRARSYDPAAARGGVAAIAGRFPGFLAPQKSCR